VLVDALATNGQLEVLDSTLGDPVVIGVGIVGSVVGLDASGGEGVVA